ncbi:hypothetical protein M3Y96_00994200 [Aphelenchoides besseyi]|nr:hypothetical protein M3Y96_00994200 [Aphelenchoides besseyi]
MAPPGRPDFRRKSNEIVDLYRRMPKSELPSDDELEFRRRLCEIVWKVNGMKPAVLTTCRTLYFHEYNQTELFDDATKAFGLKCEDGNSLMKHMDAQQIGEFSIGTPRLGQFYFYLHFNLNGKSSQINSHLNSCTCSCRSPPQEYPENSRWSLIFFRSQPLLYKPLLMFFHFFKHTNKHFSQEFVFFVFWNCLLRNNSKGILVKLNKRSKTGPQMQRFKTTRLISITH